jgi:hypothetical protein
MTDENTVNVTFHPQEWVDTSAKPHEWDTKQLVPASDRDTVTFTVPREDATDDDGCLFPDKSYEANQLAFHDDAPNWVNEWDGAYYVTLEDG